MPQSSSNEKAGVHVDAVDSENAVSGALQAVDSNTEVHTKILRKLDWRLLPLVSLLYLLSFL